MLTVVIGKAECLLRDEAATALLALLDSRVNADDSPSTAGRALRDQLAAALSKALRERSPIELDRSQIQVLARALGELDARHALDGELRVFKDVIDDALLAG